MGRCQLIYWMTRYHLGFESHGPPCPSFQTDNPAPSALNSVGLEPVGSNHMVFEEVRATRENESLEGDPAWWELHCGECWPTPPYKMEWTAGWRGYPRLYKKPNHVFVSCGSHPIVQRSSSWGELAEEMSQSTERFLARILERFRNQMLLAWHHVDSTSTSLESWTFRWVSHQIVSFQNMVPVAFVTGKWMSYGRPGSRISAITPVGHVALSMVEDIVHCIERKLNGRSCVTIFAFASKANSAIATPEYTSAPPQGYLRANIWTVSKSDKPIFVREKLTAFPSWCSTQSEINWKRCLSSQP